MALHPAFGPHLAGTGPLDARLAFAGLLAQNSDGQARAGVLGTPSTLVTTRADKFVNVARFAAALSRSADDGVSFIANDGTVPVEVPAAPPANSQYHVVYVRQRDSVTAVAPDPDNAPMFGIASGNAAAQPTLATALARVPVGGLPLASLLATSTAVTTNGMVVAQIFPYTAAQGSPVPFRNMSDLRGWAAAPGQLARELGEGTLYERTSNAWTATADTGWINFTPADNIRYQVATGSPLSYRRVGREVSFRGRVTKNGDASNNFFVLPDGFRPRGLVITSGIDSANVMRRIQIVPEGMISFIPDPLTATFSSLSFAQVSFFTD